MSMLTDTMPYTISRTRAELLALRDPATFASLPAEERRAYGIALRDLALESDTDGETLERLQSVVDAEPVQELAGLALAFHPSARFSQVRYLEAELLDPETRDLFARPTLPELAAVFVDPRELTFRTFENIVPVDRLFEGAEATVEMSSRAAVGPPDVGAHRFTVEPSPALRAAVERLHALDLYVAPLNAETRGGKRMIVHSERLSAALTDAIRAALPPEQLRGFSHVNPVFRLNAFTPDDAPFHTHRDTPYYDAGRGHLSKLTLLLYVTGGTGEPALRIGEHDLASVEPWTCVVFPQRHEHEGRAYRAGEKVFLRTELIFEQGEVEHDPGIAALFSRACYLTGERHHTAGVSQYAADCYDRVAAAHWEGLGPPADAARPFLLKRYRGVAFMTDGYDVWFRRGSVSLEQAAALAVLDHFNCKVAGEPFRARCVSEVVHGAGARDWVAETLAGAGGPGDDASPALVAFDPEPLLPPPELEDERICCPFHCPGADELSEMAEDLDDQDEEDQDEEDQIAAWDATRCGDVVGVFSEVQHETGERLAAAPIVFLGEEIQLNRAAFQVVGDKIYLRGDQPLTPINFAACWNYGGFPSSYLGVDAVVDAPLLGVPPILFHETDALLHLQLDFFRNSWMVRHEERRIPIPRIVQLDPSQAEELDESPWDEATAEL